jgi:hypothetical protein
MKCDFCDNENGFECMCGHKACSEHSIFMKGHNWCIACYEEGYSAYQDSLRDEQWRTERIK